MMIDISNLSMTDFKGSFKCPEYRMKRKKETQVYINAAFAIDIETTSTIYDGEKVAFPYMYQVGINKEAYCTQSYSEFYNFIERLNNHLQSIDRHIICFIHNLSYEFMFFNGFIKFDNVFATELHKVLKADYGNIHFRDSYIYSGYSLEKLSANYTKTKKVKDLDYKKYRTPHSKLTPQEERYCADDVVILNEYWLSDEVQQYIKVRGFTDLPLTNTGKVRKYCKALIHNQPSYNNRLQMIFPDASTWDMLERAFIGGVVKSNPYYTNLILNNIGSLDLTSDYPSQIIKHLYPMSKFQDCSLTTLSDLDDKYAYLIEVKLQNVESIFPMRILSMSKCYNRKGEQLDNGRIKSADELTVTLTDIDFKYLFSFYKFDYTILKAKRSLYARLPRFLAESIEHFYGEKNRLKALLKDDPNNELLATTLLNKKGMLNSIYGMMVTKDHKYNWTINDKGEWLPEDNPYYHQHRKQDFLSYQWGVWVTAWARSALYDGMLIMGANNIVYSDTDSIKGFINDNIISKINLWNAENDRLIKAGCEHYKIDYNKLKGLGRWDREHDIEVFKTLGSKRYYTKIDGVESVTISGIRSKNFIAYAERLKVPAVDFFSSGAHIPKEYTGKNTLYYCDNEDFIDYTYTHDGKIYHIPVYSYIYMEEAPWSMKLSGDYDKLLTELLYIRKKADQNE